MSDISPTGTISDAVGGPTTEYLVYFELVDPSGAQAPYIYLEPDDLICQLVSDRLDTQMERDHKYNAVVVQYMSKGTVVVKERIKQIDGGAVTDNMVPYGFELDESTGIVKLEYRESLREGYQKVLKPVQRRG